MNGNIEYSLALAEAEALLHGQPYQLYDSWNIGQGTWGDGVAEYTYVQMSGRDPYHSVRIYLTAEDGRLVLADRSHATGYADLEGVAAQELLKLAGPEGPIDGEAAGFFDLFRKFVAGRP